PSPPTTISSPAASPFQVLPYLLRRRPDGLDGVVQLFLRAAEGLAPVTNLVAAREHDLPQVLPGLKGIVDHRLLRVLTKMELANGVPFAPDRCSMWNQALQGGNAVLPGCIQWGWRTTERGAQRVQRATIERSSRASSAATWRPSSS